MATRLIIAESWDSLTFNQHNTISFLLYKYHLNSQNLNDTELTFKKLSLYCNVVDQMLKPNGFFKVQKAKRELTLKHYSDYINFIFEEVNRSVFQDHLIFKGVTYYPPANRISNISVEEFSFLDSLYYNWHHTNDDRYLNNLCATLYRKKKSNVDYIDKRLEFNKEIVSKSVDAISCLPLDVKIGIAYTFLGCKNHLISLFPNVFPKPKKEDKPTKLLKPQKYIPFGQILSKKHEFDNVKVALSEKQNIYKFLGVYENEIIESKK